MSKKINDILLHITESSYRVLQSQTICKLLQELKNSNQPFFSQAQKMWHETVYDFYVRDDYALLIMCQDV